jgi:hypothetical protein
VAIDLSEADHIALDAFIGSILTEFKSGNLSLIAARSDLAEVVAAVARDNESVKNFIRIPVMSRPHSA